MFQWFKTYLFNRSFRAEMSDNSSEDIHLQDISSINLIFDATDYEVREYCTSFAEKLEKAEINLYLLGFINNKIEENLSFPFPVYDLTDINWYGIPTSEKIEDFTTRKTHLTIIANLDDRPHMEFIGLKCDSYLKMGIASNNSQHHDISIHKSTTDIQAFLKNTMQLLRELQLISPLTHV